MATSIWLHPTKVMMSRRFRIIAEWAGQPAGSSAQQVVRAARTTSGARSITVR